MKSDVCTEHHYLIIKFDEGKILLTFNCLNLKV